MTSHDLRFAKVGLEFFITSETHHRNETHSIIRVPCSHSQEVIGSLGQITTQPLPRIRVLSARLVIYQGMRFFWKTMVFHKRVFAPEKETPGKHTRWAPTSYKWSYNHYKWPYNWVTGVITLHMEVITPLITSRGPTL